MATRTERMMLSLKPETVALIKQLGRLQGIPPSTLVAEILDEMTPMLRTMIVNIEASKDNRLEAFSHLADALSDIHIEAAQAQLDLSAKRRALVSKVTKKTLAVKKAKEARGRSGPP